MLSRNNLKLGEVSGPWGPVTDDNGSHNVNKSTTSTAQPAPAEPVEDLLSFGSSSDKPSSSLLSGQSVPYMLFSSWDCLQPLQILRD